MDAFAERQYRPETRLIHAGTLRSQFGETSEALFLTQAFVYDSAEQCAARFKGEEPGYLYSRFSNPTVAMFENRMAALEGADAARATRSERQYRPETRLIHAGTLRSQFGETSEALFLTQAFVYDSAEQCAARFKGEEPGYLYSRFSNPTVAMFENRMAALEGADAARAT